MRALLSKTTHFGKNRVHLVRSGESKFSQNLLFGGNPLETSHLGGFGRPVRSGERQKPLCTNLISSGEEW